MRQIALHIAGDHPAFAGHFPGNPIVPGVVLLDAAQRIIEADCAVTLTGIAVAKFHSPALPGDSLSLHYAPGNATLRFEIRCDARKIADGAFTVGDGAVANKKPGANKKTGANKNADAGGGPAAA